MPKITPQLLNEEFRARHALETQKRGETIERLRVMIFALDNYSDEEIENDECPRCGKPARPDAHYCWKCGKRFKR